jgi:4-hydroxybenzoyl-CoA thioesterase
MFSHRMDIEIEFGDCDPAGIVYFPNYYRFFDNATAHLVSTALGMNKRQWTAQHDIAGIPVVDVKTSFRSPSRFGDRVRIESRIVSVGRSSFVVGHQLMNGDVLGVEGEEVRVWIGKEGDRLKPLAIPDDVRSALEAGA